jgi:hypothetical protein
MVIAAVRWELAVDALKCRSSSTFVAVPVMVIITLGGQRTM